MARHSILCWDVANCLPFIVGQAFLEQSSNQMCLNHLESSQGQGTQIQSSLSQVLNSATGHFFIHLLLAMNQQVQHAVVIHRRYLPVARWTYSLAAVYERIRACSNFKRSSDAKLKCAKRRNSKPQCDCPSERHQKDAPMHIRIEAAVFETYRSSHCSVLSQPSIKKSSCNGAPNLK